MATSAGANTETAPFSASYRWAGYLLGFAMGGFFDGILLHQVLQWHHLLSALDGGIFEDIRAQILADGLFHVAMYVVAALALILLWRTRGEFAQARADRQVLGTFLIGFGAWHVIDAVLVHWILGLHRIRMDVDNRLLWDLLWFFVFGIVFIAAGWLLLRAAGRGGGSGGLRQAGTPAVLILSVLTAGTVAALPPADSTTVTVVFRGDMTAPQMFAAVASVDGRVIWNDPSGQLWAIDLDANGDASTLYGRGALFVSSSFFPAGCFSWSRP